MKAVLVAGIALLVGAFGLTLAAIWAHGDVVSRLAATATVLGIVGAVIALAGWEADQ